MPSITLDIRTRRNQPKHIRDIPLRIFRKLKKIRIEKIANEWLKQDNYTWIELFKLFLKGFELNQEIFYNEKLAFLKKKTLNKSKRTRKRRG